MAILLAITSREAMAQHPLGEGSLLVGNGYFAPSDNTGDGTWRYAEGRWLPFGHDSFRLGLYLSGIEVESKINNFYNHSQEIGIGLAFNFTIQPGYSYDHYGWINTAWKRVSSTGILSQGINLYENSQNDQMLFIGGGLLFRNLMFDFPFAQQKVMFEFQTTFISEQTERWNGDTLLGVPWNRERFKLQIENGLTPIYLDWGRNLYLMPSVLAVYTYEKGSQTSFYTAGLSLTLAKGEYAYDILTLSYEPKFWTGGARIDVFQVSLNIVNIFRKTY